MGAGKGAVWRYHASCTGNGRKGYRKAGKHADLPRTAGSDDLPVRSKAGRGKNADRQRLFLNEEQQLAVQTILKEWDQKDKSVYLLHGVTGSGKTEVYMELIDFVRKQGKQAIFLIPEIALTYQMVLRFYQRFGSRVSILHSRMSAGERYDQYEKAKMVKLTL